MSIPNAYDEYAAMQAPWPALLPAHWSTRRLKFVASVRPSNVDKKSEPGEVQVRLCNYVDVYNNEFITEDLDFMVATASVSEIQRFGLIKDDVVITKDSESWDDIAVPAYVSENVADLVCGYHLALLRPNRLLIEGKFLYYSLRALGIADQFKPEASGVTRYGLGTTEISDAVLPYPPLGEQRAIVGFLDRELDSITRLEQHLNSVTGVLDEYRTAIVTAAVTGQIDVRPLSRSGEDVA